VPPLSESVCVTCGTPLGGEFCPHCGERRAEAHDLSLRGFLKDSFTSISNFDARGYRSLRHLVTRPGLLTDEYVAGRRTVYLTPIQLFLVTNVLFFISASFLPTVTFYTPLSSQIDNGVLGHLIAQMLREKFTTFDAQGYVRYEARFNDGGQQQAKSLVILFAPMFAFALALMRVARREPAGKHLVFSIHFVAYSLVLFIGAGVVLGVLRLFGPINSNSGWIPAVVIVFIVAWLAPAFRRAYASSWAAALAQALVFGLLYIPFLGLFRLLLFFTVFYTT
jgi:hypothetical protein